jgi:HD-GYP domain-containing protein (c-di-GMP phosphodiesterase class II)
MTHVPVGVEIVRPLVNEKITDMVEHHHDRYDGGGINQLIAGDDIPLGARILAVADAFDAMIRDRPYRSAMSITQIVEEIKRCAGTQFDPVVVAAFLNTVGLTNP